MKVQGQRYCKISFGQVQEGGELNTVKSFCKCTFQCEK